jgi:hypothetical protein
MTGTFEKKTIKILALDKFISEPFLRRLQNLLINLELAIIINTRTNIFLSVSDKSLLRNNNAQDKMKLIKNILDGCVFEDSIFPLVDDVDALVPRNRIVVQ